MTVDVRVIAATNRDLAEMIRTGRFRDDLYYRLQVIEIMVPPLRERRDEILPLVEFFLLKYSRRYGRPAARPSRRLYDALAEYPWPGNVRELENVIKRFVILQDERLVLAELERPRRLEPVRAEPAASGASFVHPRPRRAGPMTAKTTSPCRTPRPPRLPESDSGPAKLPELARRAALSAEREAIQSALDRLALESPQSRRGAGRELQDAA